MNKLSWSERNAVLRFSVAGRLEHVALETGVDALRPGKVRRNVAQIRRRKGRDERTLVFGQNYFYKVKIVYMLLGEYRTLYFGSIF